MRGFPPLGRWRDHDDRAQEYVASDKLLLNDHEAICGELEGKGYRRIAAPEKFVVTGKYGPLKAGELDRARAWGASLATAMGA